MYLQTNTNYCMHSLYDELGSPCLSLRPHSPAANLLALSLRLIFPSHIHEETQIKNSQSGIRSVRKRYKVEDSFKIQICYLLSEVKLVNSFICKQDKFLLLDISFKLEGLFIL